MWTDYRYGGQSRQKNVLFSCWAKHLQQRNYRDFNVIGPHSGVGQVEVAQSSTAWTDAPDTKDLPTVLSLAEILLEKTVFVPTHSVWLPLYFQSNVQELLYTKRQFEPCCLLDLLRGLRPRVSKETFLPAIGKQKYFSLVSKSLPLIYSYSYIWCAF